MGSKFQRANQLPKDLKELAVRNALDVRHASFHSDMDKLIRDLKRQLAEHQKEGAQHPMSQGRAIARQQGEKERPRRDAETKRRASEEGRRKIVEDEAQRPAEEETRQQVEIFVSYRRLDDAPPPDRPKESGFVSFLLTQLRWELANLGVSNAILLKDRSKIAPADNWTEEISNALKTADLFIAIVSKNYVTSSWCQKELSTIQSRLEIFDGDAGERRIFRVDKHEVPENQIPEPLRIIQAVRFYGVAPRGQRIDEYFWRGKVRRSRQYQEAVHELALAIYRRLDELGILFQRRPTHQDEA